MSYKDIIDIIGKYRKNINHVEVFNCNTNGDTKKKLLNFFFFYFLFYLFEEFNIYKQLRK